MSATLLGKPYDRIDGRLKVTGQALYAGDRSLNNLAYGYLVTSTIANGEIKSMDVSEAEKMAGTLAIYNPFNPLKLYSALSRSEGVISGDGGPPLQDQKIQFYGQIIGLVVAESFEEARDAAQRIIVTYDEEKPVASWEAASAAIYSPEVVDGEKATTAILDEGVTSIDDVLKRSEVQVEVTYTEPIYHHNPMEPHATTAVWEAGRLTIYDATQFVGGHRRNLAAVLDLDETMVQVICPFVGGAFGCKGSMWMHSPLTAAAARQLGRPIRTVLTREQMFTLVGHRPALIQTIALGCTREGQLTAVKHDAQATVAISKEFIEAAAHRTSRFLYKSPNIQVSQKLAPMHLGAPTFMRAPGDGPGMFALECAMDELAVKLEIDPIELRIKNNAEFYPGKKIPWSSKYLTECYRLGAEKFGWSKRHFEPGALKEGDWNLGMGMATALYAANRGSSAAKVRLLADGTARISSATHDLGTGMWTVMAIVGAESLGLPMNRIRPELGDSALPFAPVAGGSQSTASVGPAIRKAAESAKAKLIQLASKEKRSPLHGIDPNEISFFDGGVVAGDKRIEFSALLNALGRSYVEATEISEPGDEAKKYAFHSFGAQFCEVKVNKWTSEIRVNRITSVMDIGAVVNLKTARSQVIGGVVFGIGMALLEGSHLEKKSGRYANGNFADYLVATNADVPVIDVYFLDKPDKIFNSLGVRGVGEIGITGMPAAIANAVFNATGTRVRDFPINAEKLIATGQGIQGVT